ncbi:MAG: outer membrane protein assembly factor BamD [Thermodesulfobacteriota bacterium]|nr:outer membrane protein assembly factor BamD [Thermodesulfobacteriota bacterium]
MNVKRVFHLAAILWLALQVFGCAWFQPKEEKTAQELAHEGMEAFRDENYGRSVEAFEKLRDWYPFSKYAILAELKLGDAHYYLRQYNEAVVAYEAFESLHPKNEAVPYVVYQIGRCYFDQLQAVDRDQTTAQEAVQTFERLIRSYPESPQAKKAKAHIRICQKNLAEHEFHVGEFYCRTKHYKAALERFKAVLTAYPDLGVHYKALQYITLCQAKIENPASESK